MVPPPLRALLALAAAATLTVGCSTREPAGEPTAGEVEAGTPAEDGGAEAPSVPAETVDPTEVMMMPARLTVNADEAGAVFIDGRRMSDATPLETAEVSPGRHRVQIAWDDGAQVGDPRPALLRSDGNIILYVRRHEVTRPPSDPGVVRTEDELAEIDARLTAERAAEAAEGSAQGPPEGNLENPPEGNLDPAENPPEGNPDSDPENPPEGNLDPAENPPEGNPDSDPAGVDTAEGSGASEAPTESTGTGYLRIDADQIGTLYVDGHRTDLMTPIILERPTGEVGIQIMYESGDLSRHVDVAIADQRLRQVRFEGRELVVIR